MCKIPLKTVVLMIFVQKQAVILCVQNRTNLAQSTRLISLAAATAAARDPTLIRVSGLRLVLAPSQISMQPIRRPPALPRRMWPTGCAWWTPPAHAPAPARGKPRLHVAHWTTGVRASIQSTNATRRRSLDPPWIARCWI